MSASGWHRHLRHEDSGGSGRLLRRGAVVLLTFGLLSLPAVAHADYEDGDDGDSGGTGESDGSGGIGSGAGDELVRVTFDPPAGDSGGALTSTVWTPPACYYAPVYSPEEMEAYWDSFVDRFHTPPWPEEDVRMFRRSHEAFLEEFPDYNIDLQDEGMFWRVVRNDSFPLSEQMACESRTFWVDFTDPPPPQPHVMNTETLAALAWEETRVPDTEVSINPTGTQKVNLPMWIWLDEQEFAPVSVQATLDGYGIWARTTATPKHLTLDPGTRDARVFPASGNCEFTGGQVGEPYERGRSDEDPPCGVVYERSTHNSGDFPLRATLTWEVTWHDYLDPTPRPLADGVVETTVDISVEEVQTIVR